MYGLFIVMSQGHYIKKLDR